MPRRGSQAISIAVGLALAAAGILGVVLTPRVSANVSISLYGSASQGWGFTPTTMTIPGPAIGVAQFDSVTIRLEGMDAPRHNFFVDYNANNIPDASTEPVSPDFRNSTGFITYTFTADVAGVFTYYCDYHQSTMYGTFTVQPVNTPPSAAISMPDGRRDWTGGTVHRIWWNMSDSQDPNTALRVFLNYSYNGGATRGSIAGPVPGTSGPNFYDWTVPAIDATDMVVNLTVVDSGGLGGWDEAAVPVVDSTGPNVVATVPASGAVNVPTTATVRITWSEPMNAVVTGSSASMGLQETASGGWVQGAFSWNSPLNTVVTFDPTLSLAPSMQYRAVVNASARDDSDPGNALTAPYAWTFTTGTSADIQPPQISAVSVVPSVQNVGGTVNVYAMTLGLANLAGIVIGAITSLIIGMLVVAAINEWLGSTAIEDLLPPGFDDVTGATFTVAQFLFAYELAQRPLKPIRGVETALKDSILGLMILGVSTATKVIFGESLQGRSVS